MFGILNFARKTHDEIDQRVEEWIEALKEDAPLYPRDARFTPALPGPVRMRGAHRKT
jgi:hypothetical protein